MSDVKMKDQVCVDVDMLGQPLKVVKNKDGYQVIHGSGIKHPNASAENAMAALGHYIHSLSHQIEKLKMEIQEKEQELFPLKAVGRQVKQKM